MEDNKPKGHYLDKHHLAALVAAYVADGSGGDELAHALVLMARGIKQRYYFGHRDGDDAEQHAIYVALTKLDRCDPTKGSAFCFFTTVLLNAFRCYVKKRKHINFTDVSDQWNIE